MSGYNLAVQKRNLVYKVSIPLLISMLSYLVQRKLFETLTLDQSSLLWLTNDLVWTYGLSLPSSKGIHIIIRHSVRGQTTHDGVVANKSKGGQIIHTRWVFALIRTNLTCQGIWKPLVHLDIFTTTNIRAFNYCSLVPWYSWSGKILWLRGNTGSSEASRVLHDTDISSKVGCATPLEIKEGLLWDPIYL